MLLEKFQSLLGCQLVTNLKFKYTGCAKIPSWMKNDMKARIINGKSAESPIPWQVHVHSLKGICGGTILDEETILSAAHCFEGEIKVIV